MKRITIFAVFLMPVLILTAFFTVLHTEASPIHLTNGMTFTVNSTIDAVDANPGDGVCETAVGNGICTLRAAINEGNTYAGLPVTITLPAGTYETILSNYHISNSLKIIGDTPFDTIITNSSGEYLNLFWIDHPYQEPVELVNLTLQQGYTPGSGGRNILSEGSLIISKTQILSGTYSGIFDFPGGAGILNYDEMTIINSTIAYNHTESAAEGGGIYNLGSLTLENATLTNNIDVPYVFGISTSGIYNNGSVFITNSTISNTITNEFGGSTTLQNTIIMFCKGANYISQDYNLSSADNCNLTQTNDITSTNPLLAPPSNNGGSILTNALLFGSPAVDAASNNSCPLTDQRGIQRPIDGNGDGVAVCDIGAFEAPEAITIVIDNPTVIESANIISFTIMLSDSPIESVSVAYSTADITATAFTDYIPVSGTLFFNSGEISQTIQVAILNDTLDEADETFAVNLSDPINAFIIEGQGIGVIKDDDYQLFLPTITK